MKANTPLMRQYAAAKAAHPGVLVAMRVGDFYEFYGPDAETAAKALEITLTGRDDGKDNRVAMAGVPFHSVERYLARLLQAGFKVALCDQVEDPKKAKGLVRREVTRVMTPGTVLEDAMLASRSNQFLGAVTGEKGHLGLAVLDASTGECMVTEITGEDATVRMAQEIGRLGVAELLLDEGDPAIPPELADSLGVPVSWVSTPARESAARRLSERLGAASLAGFDLEHRPQAVRAAVMALDYATRNGLNLDHVPTIGTYTLDDFVMMDPSTRRALELTQNSSDGGLKLTLLSVLDHTATAMGARLLRRWVEQPLCRREPIEERHEAVARLREFHAIRDEMRTRLERVADIERLTSRTVSGLASPRDLAALRDSLKQLPDAGEALRKLAVGRLETLHESLGDHRDLTIELERALEDEPPMTLRDGGVIRDGFDPNLDTLRTKSREGKDYIAQLERTEREATGIDRLKVGYNSVFGYYLEVSKVHTSRVPEHYIRKQTTANAERYITAELKEHESAVLGADEKAISLEADLLAQVRARVAREAPALLQTARALAEADVLAGLALAADRNRYVRPEFIENGLEIEEGRHPVVETQTPGFVPNDLTLDDNRRLMVLTGPNMSGKSTFLRQAALIALMAQMGSFVPARRCRLSVCDRVFARIGARDEIALGQSTFMVEMVESAHILNNATDRSLVILDEVGRGTSTFDGLAIAWAMVEELAARRAMTLFATHYHQLNAVADQISSVFNCRVDVSEQGDEIVWTHRVVSGGADRSYGLQVARMAGVPGHVCRRAQSVLDELEGQEAAPEVSPLPTTQMSLFEAAPSEVERELERIEVDRLSPLEALLKLDELKRKLPKG